jgi:predicted Zn-dependent protease
MAMTKAGKGEDVVNLLYKLEYENPDNVTVNNTLGWTLMYVHKPEQALTTLQKAISDKAGQTSRVLNLAYAYLINNNIAEGAKLLHSIPKETRLDSINEDAELLSMYGIGPAEIAILSSEE